MAAMEGGFGLTYRAFEARRRRLLLEGWSPWSERTFATRMVLDHSDSRFHVELALVLCLLRSNAGPGFWTSIPG